MEVFNSIEKLAIGVNKKLNTTLPKKKIVAIYAFNATGKTRLSKMLTDINEDGETLETEDGEIIETESGEMIEINTGNIKSICYNAFLEDMFVWDNESYILKFDLNSWIIKLIIEQGLETQIINNFKDIVNSQDIKLEPSFNFIAGEVAFKIASGDNDSESNIKISKGEESVFIWSVFYTLLETAISELIIKKENRSTSIFDDLETIIIDDPVSSIDDTRIITLAVKLVDLLKNDHIDIHLQKEKQQLEQQEFGTEYIKKRLKEMRLQNHSELTLKFLLTTHHALYYNVLVNSFRQERRVGNFQSFSLSKDNISLKLKEQGDAPFSYHLTVKELIQKAIDDDSIEKYHFNLFRALLEKTANFLGYENRYDCLTGDNKQESNRLLNLHSHNKLSDLESNELSSRDKELFQETFVAFMQSFNWN